MASSKDTADGDELDLKALGLEEEDAPEVVVHPEFSRPGSVNQKEYLRGLVAEFKGTTDPVQKAAVKAEIDRAVKEEKENTVLRSTLEVA